MAAYSSGLEGSMERLEESNAMLAVHLEQHVQPSVEAAGGNADEWTERLMKSWVDAQRGEQTNQESLLETTHELEERFGILREAEELVRDGLLEAELAMQESVRQSDEVLETSYAATDAAILLQGKRPGADTAGCRLQSLNTGKVRDNQLLRFHFTVGAANNVTSDMIEQGLRRRLADNLNQDAIQSGGDQAIYEKHRWWKMPSSSEVDEFDTSSSINTLTRRLLIGKHAVVGGILCHVTRKKDDRNKPCTKRFEHIGAPCFTQPVFGTYFGRDTIFTPGATLYRADLQEDMWKYYNTSAGSVMLDEFTGRPHAFWPRHLPGYGVGYPFYIDTRLNERRAQEMYTYIEEGLLIDQSTDEISANLVTWNSQLQSFGLMRLMWHRVNRGDFQVRYQVWNLKVTYWNVDSAWDAFYLLVNIAWISLSVSSFFRELAKLRPEALARRRSVYSRYLHKLKPHLSATLRLLALASATLQMIVVMLFVGYHYLMLHALHVDRHYHVYHSLHALANLFLSPRRLGPAAGGKEAEGADSVASLEEEGAALLWALPEDNHGLETYAHRLQEINLAGRLHQSVYTVQACWVLIMIPQLCLTLEQQPSFQRIVKALRKSAQYFSEVVPFFVALGAFSVLFHITFGLKLETYHTFTRSLNRLSLFSFLKKYHKLRYVTMMWEAKDVMETSFDNLIVFCFHVFFFINREIMFVMIRQALTVMKRKKISLCQRHNICTLIKLYIGNLIRGWPRMERLVELMRTFSDGESTKRPVRISHMLPDCEHLTAAGRRVTQGMLALLIRRLCDQNHYISSSGKLVQSSDHRHTPLLPALSSSARPPPPDPCHGVILLRCCAHHLQTCAMELYSCAAAPSTC
ncbi:hypothetical protein CYMTET_46658 [Cymbomonas tetramitiformis]|uniref:Uncharacterized protein n=1 Tax=Cymbomonas tetramitiformis TaxID=36881 RepID=A0AAE0EYG8_9CHLO|nr:hypothetical protein CYMTET_46658 [Cymbomonas tetramitiformis]